MRVLPLVVFVATLFMGVVAAGLSETSGSFGAYDYDRTEITADAVGDASPSTVDEQAESFDDRVRTAVAQQYYDRSSWRGAVPQGRRAVLTGTRGSVDIRVIVDSRTGEIITGYPTNLPRNPG